MRLQELQNNCCCVTHLYQCGLFILVLFSAAALPGEEPEFVRAKNFFKDEFLVSKTLCCISVKKNVMNKNSLILDSRSFCYMTSW